MEKQECQGTDTNTQEEQLVGVYRSSFLVAEIFSEIEEEDHRLRVMREKR